MAYHQTMIAARALLAILLASGCGPTKPDPTGISNEPTTDPPTIRSHADIEARAFQRVQVEGIYEQIDVRKKHPGSEPPVYRGHAALRLADGRLVTLEPPSEPAAVRSPDEIARFEGKRAVAVGKLYPLGAATGEHVARMLTPCLWPVESLALAP